MINKWNEQDAMFYENGYYLTSKVSRIGNILSHYELYKKIINMPGDIVECGVFRGGSLIQWCTFRELLENEMSRRIIGFDVFGEFPMTEYESDKIWRENWQKETNGEFLSDEELYKSLKFKGVSNVELVKGNIMETLDKYVIDNPNLRISLLHIDTDVYEPAKKALEVLYDRVIPGGLIVSDDYGIAGETKALDEFFGEKVELHKFPFSHNKPVFIVK